MKLNLYSIYDRKMNLYLAPFPARGDVDAIRNVSQSLRAPDVNQTPIGQSPADFDLVKIGEFDDDIGTISGSHPLTLANIATLIPSAQLPS